MCVAIFKVKGRRVPTKQELQNCFRTNNDGAGFSWLDRRGSQKLFWEKGFMSFRSFWKAFSKKNFKKSDQIMVHFRITSHGKTSRGNTHPFPISNDFHEMQELSGTTDKLLMHNGILDCGTTKEFSDTMEFVKIISKFDIKEKDVRRLIGMARGNSKIAIMQGSTVYYWGDWIEENGVYFSNSSYEDKKKIPFYYSGYSNYNYHNYYERFAWGEDSEKEREMVFDDNICPECFLEISGTSSYIRYCDGCMTKFVNENFFIRGNLIKKRIEQLTTKEKYEKHA